MTNNASWSEGFWTLLSIVGLIWCWWLWRDATRTRHYWEAEGLNGSTNIATRNNLRASGIRTIRMGLYTLIGVMAMMLPSAVPSTVQPSFIRYIIPLAFITATGLDVFDAVMSRRERERMLILERRRLRQMKGHTT